MKKCPQCGREYQDTNSICTSDGAALEKAGDALVGQTLADKYRVEEHLSEGGMGTVYRGTHVLMDKTVAIKVLHPALAADDKIVQRFSREARAASRISHPHALNVTDFGESENGVVFLVMEYLRGRTLKEVIHQDGQMPLTRVVEIMRQVTGALAAAHAEGVVHRDLKSDNIMLVDADHGQDWAKVLDFGIAKIQEPLGQDPALTAPNLIIGTPQYMSPEQCSQASELDARSDIYSLGVILYEMLVGHVPFSGDSPTAVMMKHLQEPPPSLLEDRSDLPPAVSRIVTRAMAKRPEDRYQTVGELADALALAAEGQTLPDAAAAAGMVTAGVAPERATARIVVPTASNNAPRPTTDIEQDDSTIVVPPQPGRSAVVETESINPQYAAPPPPENFNLGRVIGLSAVALLVVFAIVYAITSRKSAAPANNQNATQLTSDPNGQPVTPAQAPTGQSEKGITAPTTTAAPSNTNANTSAVNPNSTFNGTANRETGAALPGVINTNTNGKRRNTGANITPVQNDNAANMSGVEVVAPESNKNSERPQQPTPQNSPAANANSDDAEPPPPPAQKKKQPPSPKPTPPATDNTTPPPPSETPAV